MKAGDRERTERGTFTARFSRADLERAAQLVNDGAGWRGAAAAFGDADPWYLRRLVVAADIPFVRGHRTTQKPMRMHLPASPTDRAYLAGIIDGEGCITIAHTPRETVRLAITNTDSGLMDWLLAMGGNAHAKSGGRLGTRTCWEWQVYGRLDVLAVLEAVVPFMRIKRAKAERGIHILREWRDA